MLIIYPEFSGIKKWNDNARRPTVKGEIIVSIEFRCDMEPKRVLIIEPVSLKDGNVLNRWSYVWKLREEKEGTVVIEHKNREYKIAAEYIVTTPVSAPSSERLVALDPCFLDLKKYLHKIYLDESKMFSVYRCPHSNYFLEDLRGGIAMFSVWIFLGSFNDQSSDHWKSLWKDYHCLPTDAIYYLGIGC